MSEPSPSEDRTFRGGFRILDVDDPDEGRRVVDAWGADVAETAARCVESVFVAMGRPQTLVAAPPLEIVASGSGAAALIADAVERALACHSATGRWVQAVKLRGIQRREDEAGGADRLTMRLSLEGGAVDRAAEPDLRRVRLAESAVERTWQENQLLRVRLHLHIDGEAE